MKNFFSISQNADIKNIALGKFDGVHLAHQELFKHLDKQGCVIIIDKSDSECLTSIDDRERLIPYSTFLLPFKEIHMWNGEEFIKFLKLKLPNLEKIIVGYDFRFGKDKNYGADDLKDLFNGEVIVINEVKNHNIPLHSSIIKELINFGDIKLANKLLGRNYTLKGEVIKGQNLGSKELYPTINIATKNYILPGNGVYASFTYLKDIRLKSVSFVGNRLSTDRIFSIETHILDKDIILKNENISIEFIQKIRENRHFNELNKLKIQIQKDINEAKNILKDF